MASRKQTSMVDGQNSDAMGEKDKLISVTGNIQDPYKAKASDFPVKKVMAATGQSSDAPGEQDTLVPWDGNKTSPRNAEVPGMGEKDSMASRQASVSSNFKVETNRGESGVAPGDVKNMYSVDCTSGKIHCDSYKPTRVGEVEEDEVSIG